MTTERKEILELLERIERIANEHPPIVTQMMISAERISALTVETGQPPTSFLTGIEIVGSQYLPNHRGLAFDGRGRIVGWVETEGEPKDWKVHFWDPQTIKEVHNYTAPTFGGSWTEPIPEPMIRFQVFGIRECTRQGGAPEEPKKAVKICDGCNVREPWEHRCFGAEECECPDCREIEGMSREEILKLTEKEKKGGV